MDQATLDALFERGRAAGAELVSRFADGEHELNWDNHRWIRYRTLMTALEEMHGQLEYAYHLEREGERTYNELLTRGKKEPPKSYHLAGSQGSKAHQAFAREITADLLELAATWSESEVSLKDGSPQPHPKLRITAEA